MKAQQLLEYLQELATNHDLNEIDVNYRYDYDSDVTSIDEIHEDLFDESNKTLTSICIIGDTYDYEAEYNSFNTCDTYDEFGVNTKNSFNTAPKK